MKQVWRFFPSPNREPDDYYATPQGVTEALLGKVRFAGSIWEPACGQGHISKVLRRWYPYSRIISTDLIDRGYGESGVDFLKTRREVDNVITNPPFKLAFDFARHAVKLAGRKVALLLPLHFVEGACRYHWFIRNPPRFVYVISTRVRFLKGGVTTQQHLDAVAWYVWTKGYRGDTVLRWILDAKKRK